MYIEFEVKLSVTDKNAMWKRGGERDENLGLLKWSRQISHLVIDKMITLH